MFTVLRFYLDGLYLTKKNKLFSNDATLDQLNIKWEHKKLSKFGTKEAGDWNDAEYTEERFCYWGDRGEGFKEMQALVAQWAIHIKLGKLAAAVLVEYLDSRIHCFDNTQKKHPTSRKDPVAREEMTELAQWQVRKLAPVLEKYTAGPLYTCPRI